MSPEYIQGFLDKFAEKGIKPSSSFFSELERSMQKQRLNNKGLNAGKGVRLENMPATQTGQGVDKSIGIKYDYGNKEAGIMEHIGKYSVPMAERIKRWASRIKGGPEDGADLLNSIKGMNVGEMPQVDAIYRDLGKKTTALGLGAAGGVGLNQALGDTEIQDAEAPA